MPMRADITLTRLLLFALALSYGCGQQPDLPPGVFNPVNQSIDSAIWQQPHLVDNGELPEGKFIALLWASWCPPCLAEHDYIMELANQGIPLVGIAFKDATADTLAVIEQFGNPYRVLFGDPETRMATQLGGSSVPTAFVVDAQHRLRARIIGGIHRRNWETRGLGDWFAALE